MNDGSEVVAPAVEGWETSIRAAPDAAPVLAVDGFAGPLDWWLALARAERIDLRRISILQLVEAFARALEAALAIASRADLARWGAWLAMAAQLTLLRSRLLLPPDAAAAKAAQADAEALRRQLLDGDAMRRAATWLERRHQLGHEMFGRGLSADARTASARGADITALFRACLVALRVPEHAESYTPPRLPLWRVQDAAARITRLLDDGVEGALDAFLPKIAPHGPGYDLRCRAAVASTFVAGLELARAGVLCVIQEQPSHAVRIDRVEVGGHQTAAAAPIAEQRHGEAKARSLH